MATATIDRTATEHRIPTIDRRMPVARIEYLVEDDTICEYRDRAVYDVTKIDENVAELKALGYYSDYIEVVWNPAHPDAPSRA